MGNASHPCVTVLLSGELVLAGVGGGRIDPPGTGLRPSVCPVRHWTLCEQCIDILFWRADADIIKRPDRAKGFGLLTQRSAD